MDSFPVIHNSDSLMCDAPSELKLDQNRNASSTAVIEQSKHCNSKMEIRNEYTFEKGFNEMTDETTLLLGKQDCNQNWDHFESKKLWNYHDQTKTMKSKPMAQMKNDTNMKEEEEKDSKSLNEMLPKYRVTDKVSVNFTTLLQTMKKNFEKKRRKWNRRRRLLSALNFFMSMTVFAIQATQVLVVQLVDPEMSKIVSTVLPVVASIFAAVNQLLNWSSKAAKCKKASKRYNILVSEVENRLDMIKSDGLPSYDEMIKLWQVSSTLERSDPHLSQNVL